VALKYRGRTIVVPVIDRGPYSRGVSYDLTAATARKLGMTETSRVGAAPLGN
jgi:rare lipoprotein A (peptidoglycan hydrolase)